MQDNCPYSEECTRSYYWCSLWFYGAIYQQQNLLLLFMTMGIGMIFTRGWGQKWVSKLKKQPVFATNVTEKR